MPGYSAAQRNPNWAGMYGQRVGRGFGGQVIGPAANYNPGAGAGAISGIAGLYQSQYDEARRANEQRYGDILGGHQDLYGRVMGGLEGRSGQAEADITKSYDAAAAAGQQRMVSQGLSSSTIAETMRQGSEGEKSAALNRYRDEMLERRAGYDVGLTGSRLGFMERREDEYPNQGVLMQLMQMVGQAGPQGLSPELMSLLTAALGGGSTAGTAAGGFVRGSSPAPIPLQARPPKIKPGIGDPGINPNWQPAW